MKKILAISALLLTTLWSNPIGEATTKAATKEVKSTVIKDDKGVVEKKTNKLERKAKTKVIKSAL